MTEIPEHLRKRAEAAKAKATGAPAPAEAPAEAAAAAPTTAPAEAASPAPVVEAPPEPVAHYVEAANSRKTIPWWVAGTLLLLPVWAISYVGTLERPPQEATGVPSSGWPGAPTASASAPPTATPAAAASWRAACPAGPTC